MDIDKKLFRMQRFAIVKTKLNKETEHLIPDAYAYAWYAGVYPLLDQSDLHEGYEECFTVTKEQVDIVTKYADQEWLENKRYTFYEYEDHFNVRYGNPRGIDRHALISIFRYCFLNRGFDDQFWETLIEPMKHPAEASSVTMPFNSDYLYLV